ncbi:hypothetical protein LCGC14_0673630 [marine sediment metagenome]|uniref:Uncharacterized protein n=1 Tax=marine sediment metagenome TaxID=412755 RepID=A0A0F9RAN0_9ZZZZ
MMVPLASTVPLASLTVPITVVAAETPGGDPISPAATIALQRKNRRKRIGVLLLLVPACLFVPAW